MKNNFTGSSRESEIIGAVIEVLKKRLDPPKIYIFGSRAKKANSNSADFDIACESARPDITLERKIREEIDKSRGLYKVDIVYLLSVEKDFRDVVLKTGKVIYDKGN